ncbi:hypothetical protein BV898_07012 [Hypsibius exemplaris]|uniref:Uncharacterized protein n=1 Tax=Hypsibius exemplaris TaxID=2072580 RepID=A0A1W0WUX7_HYPEX|nr:hypothetical protein BV898_07012 [Hypsibius exemplaris]
MDQNAQPLPLAIAFKELTDAIAERLRERDRRQQSTLELKRSIKQKADELERLDEMFAELSNPKSSFTAEGGEDELTKTMRKEAEVEEKLRFWRQTNQLLATLFRVRMKFKHDDENTPGASGFIIDQKDISRKMVLAPKISSLNAVDQNWKELEDIYIHQKKAKKPIKEPLAESLTAGNTSTHIFLAKSP